MLLQPQFRANTVLLSLGEMEGLQSANYQTTSEPEENQVEVYASMNLD